MINLPMRAGYFIEWDGETITNKVGKTRTIKESIETRNYEEAKRIKEEREKQGYKNVTIGECFF